MFIFSSMNGHLACFQFGTTWIVLIWTFFYMLLGGQKNTFIPSFILLMWCITLTNFHMLNRPCIPGTKSTCSLVLLICCWILFASVLLRTFASVFIRDVCFLKNSTCIFCFNIAKESWVLFMKSVTTCISCFVKLLKSFIYFLISCLSFPFLKKKKLFISKFCGFAYLKWNFIYSKVCCPIW